MEGRKFSRLTVISFAGQSNDGRYEVFWLCRCDCGKELVTRGHLLRRGEIVSCGCARITHGWCRRGLESSEHNAWRNMIKRCNNPQNHNYARYGGRGITVCQRWMSFDNFLADMGLKPSQELSIERIDNDKGYFPENCKWATTYEQAANRSIPKSKETYRRNSGKPCRRKLTSKYKGVSLSSAGRWYAMFRPPREKCIYLGTFDTEIGAARAFNQAAREIFGDKAFLNDVPD